MQASTSLTERRFLVPLVLGWSIQTAFVVPVICHAFILYFALWGYRSSRPELAQPERGLAPDIG
jgi:hypothetical protein